MRVQDVMTKEVRTVEADTSLKDVARLLTELGISGLPVVEDGKVVGVVSEADILVKERAINPARHGLVGMFHTEGVDVGEKLRALTAGEAMTSPAITITPARPVSEAAGRMIDGHINRLPVVTDDGVLIGIVTRADLVRAFVRPDDEIATEIREDVVLRTLWIAPEQVTGGPRPPGTGNRAPPGDGRSAPRVLCRTNEERSTRPSADTPIRSSARGSGNGPTTCSALPGISGFRAYYLIEAGRDRLGDGLRRRFERDGVERGRRVVARGEHAGSRRLAGLRRRGRRLARCRILQRREGEARCSAGRPRPSPGSCRRGCAPSKARRT